MLAGRGQTMWQMVCDSAVPYKAKSHAANHINSKRQENDETASNFKNSFFAGWEMTCKLQRSNEIWKTDQGRFF